MSCLATQRRSETERDCGMRTYCDVRRAENESAYSNANETNGMSENPPATRRTRSPPFANGNYDDPSPCAALSV